MTAAVRPFVTIGRWTRTVLWLPALVLMGSSGLNAQNWSPEEVIRQESWVKPPAVVERIITTKRVDISFSNPSPDRQWFLRTATPDRDDIKDYGKPHLYLGGLEVDHRANRARQLTMRAGTALILVDPRTNAERRLQTPAGATISSPTWSPTGTHIAYFANTEDASHVYVAEVASGRSTQVTRTPVLATMETGIDWSADGRSIAVVLLPDNRGPAPTHGEGGIEDGPQVRLTEGEAKPQRVYWSLLEDPHDKDILRYYTTGQLAIIDVRSRAVKKVGSPQMFRSIDMSPDGGHVRVSIMREPFSYIVPTSAFGSVDQLWDASGAMVAELGATPLREGDAGFGRGGASAEADTGRRGLQWNPVGPGMTYLQSVYETPNAGGRAGRGGAGRAGQAGGAPTPSSVRYVSWLPPYRPTDTKVLYEGSGRLTSVGWSADGQTMFVADSGTVYAVRVADTSKRYTLGRGVTLPGGGGFGGFGRGGRGGGGGGADSTVLGGALALKQGPNGAPVVVVGTDNKSVFLSGNRTPGANWQMQAPRPWVDKLDFESGQRSRIFDAPANAYEQFVAALDDDYSQYIYNHESPTVIEDAWLRDAASGQTTKLTSNVDAAPEVTGAQRLRMQVTRPRDGMKFWVNVTMPRDWQRGTRLPGVIWFYPREYTTAADYERSKYNTNINQFPSLTPARPASSIPLWVAHGYALLEPDSPIMGDTGRMNDNYIQDLTENLDAVLDAAVDSGFVDRDRMGLGGHSYGAFSTVNAMTVVPFFRAGIAGDGMYNRSLTPFGFQSERRSFYEAQDTYLDMSPFFRADKLSGALLMYHSLEDENVGTAPLSSIRMMQALQGLGKTAALYMYPYEDHSVGTYQSDLDQWARWLAWFDLYVKNPKPEMKVVP